MKKWCKYLQKWGKCAKIEVNKIYQKKGENQMEPKDYTVIKIEGEYAYLRDDASPETAPLFIALALLPMGTDEGTRLHCELFQYEIIE